MNSQTHPQDMQPRADQPLGGFFSFCPVLSDMLLTRNPAGRTGKEFAGAGSLSTINNLHVLRKLHLALKPQRSLEIGLCYGGSALVFAATHRDLKAPPRRQHVALDPFQTEMWDDSGLLALERAGLLGYLDFRPVLSSVQLPEFWAEGKQFDLIYVDGSHLFEDVFVDTYYATRLLAHGGTILYDDCPTKHVSKVLSFLLKALKDSFEEVDLSPYRFDGGRSVKFHAAKLTGRVQLRGFRKIGPGSRPWNAPYVDF